MGSITPAGVRNDPDDWTVEERRKVAAEVERLRQLEAQVLDCVERGLLGRGWVAVHLRALRREVLDTSLHGRRLAERMRDPEFRAAYEQARLEARIAQEDYKDRYGEYPDLSEFC